MRIGMPWFDLQPPPAHHHETTTKGHRTGQGLVLTNTDLDPHFLLVVHFCMDLEEHVVIYGRGYPL